MESTLMQEAIDDQAQEELEQLEEGQNEEAWDREKSDAEAQERFESLVAEAIAFANKYIKPYADAAKTFCAKFAAQADLFMDLKAEFHTRPGSHTQTVHVVDGNEYTWTTFCPAHLGVSAQWVNKQIQKYRSTQDGSNKPEKLDEEKPLYKKGFEAGTKKAKEEIQLASVPEPQPPILETNSEDKGDGLPTDPEGTTDIADDIEVITYFAQFKRDKEAMADVFKRILRHYGLARQIAVELI